MKKILSNFTCSFILVISLFSCTSNSVSNNNQIKNDSNATANTKSLKVLKTISVGKTPHGISQAQGFVYNSNIGEGTVSVIDTNKDEVVKTISLNGGIPGYSKAFHDGKNILLLDTKNGYLLVIDPSQDHKILQSITVGNSPDKINISEDDKTVIVSLVGEDKVIYLTFDSDRGKPPVKKEFKIGSMIKGSEYREVDFNDNLILTPNSGDNDVSLVNIETGNEKKLKDGNNPSVVKFGLVNNKPKVAIVGNSSSNTVTLFDLNSDNKKTLTEVGLAPTDGAIVDELNRIFITMAGSNEVGVIDYDKQTFVGKIPVGSRPVHIYLSPAIDNKKGLSIKHDDTGTSSNELWVGNDNGDSVSIIDASNLSVKYTVKVGKGHHKMTFANNKAYVSNITDNTITVISRTEN